MNMLRIGAILNFIIAIAHILGLLVAENMFRLTGIEKEMRDFAQIYPFLPYLLTIFVAFIFFIFGLYGLSAAQLIRELPSLKLGIFFISALYIFRGIGGFFFKTSLHESYVYLEISYSLLALLIGLLYLIGGLIKWNYKIH